ncbi:MAG: coproporphyrinogen III oxidase family protein, partial [Candidatus Zixiibacteriota bacterium]
MPFGLYLHFPFCRNRCSYCDFYKELYQAGLEKDFFDALAVETELVAEEYAALDNEIATIYVGGGTPSLVNLDFFATWLDQLRSLFYVGPEIEFSFENNPDSVTREKLLRLKELGVNRPVFGIQSFRPDLLKLLNRRHEPNDSHRCIYLANALGFDNYGVDIIFGLPKQNSEALSRDLDQIIDLAPPHISFYQLTVEPGTALADRVASGALKMPDPDFSFGLYRGGCERL